MRSSSTSSRVI